MERKEDLVSIIIPTYNCAEYIEKAIDSALNQTYKNIEVIVIDDNSTDSTEKVIERYKNKIIYIKSQKNKGPSASRNHGIEISSGDFITFLDADDFLLPNFIETGINTIKNYRNEKVWLGFDRVIWNGKKGINPLKLKNSYEMVKLNLIQDPIETMITKAPIITPFIPRDAFIKDKLFFNPKIKHAEDLDLWFRLIFNGWRLILIENRSYIYRRNRPGSLTQDKIKLSASLIRIYYNLLLKKKLKFRYLPKILYSIYSYSSNYIKELILNK